MLGTCFAVLVYMYKLCIIIDIIDGYASIIISMYIQCSCAANVSVVWSGAYRRTPFILFRADAVQGLDGPIDHPFSSENDCINHHSNPNIHVLYADNAAYIDKYTLNDAYLQCIIHL